MKKDKIKYYTKSEKETEDVGFALAAKFKEGDIVGLVGELGSGKTRFVKGFARSLGINPKSVKSPSFTLMNIYNGSKKLIHIDLYRIQKSEEVYDLGINDYAFDKNITIVEWSEKAESQLNPNCTIYFTVLGENRREISVTFNPC